MTRVAEPDARNGTDALKILADKGHAEENSELPEHKPLRDPFVW